MARHETLDDRRVRARIQEDEPPAKGQGAHLRERVVARHGLDLLAIPIERVAWFMSERRLTIVCEKTGARHLVDERLGELVETLDPRRFFRVNRQFLAQVEAVKSFHPVGKGRLGVLLDPDPDEDVVVSQERAAEFRAWVEGR